MTSGNTSEKRRVEFHRGRVDTAETPKAEVWALCHWLVAEAWHADRVADTITVVEQQITNIRTARSEARKAGAQ